MSECCIVTTINNYTYTYACRIIFNTVRTNEDTSLEKYTSYFIGKGSKGILKVFQCERWVRDWTELQHTDPTLMAITAFLSRSPGLLNRWLGGPASLGHGPHSSIFSPTELELPVHRVILLFYAHSIQPVDSQGYPLETFDRMHLLFTLVHLLFWQLGWGQYATRVIFIFEWFRQ